MLIPSVYADVGYYDEEKAKREFETMYNNEHFKGLSDESKESILRSYRKTGNSYGATDMGYSDDQVKYILDHWGDQNDPIIQREKQYPFNDDETTQWENKLGINVRSKLIGSSTNTNSYINDPDPVSELEDVTDNEDNDINQEEIDAQANDLLKRLSDASDARQDLLTVASGAEPRIRSRAQTLLDKYVQDHSEEFEIPQGDDPMVRQGKKERIKLALNWAKDEQDLQAKKELEDRGRIIYTLPDRKAVGAEKGEIGLDQAIKDSEKFLEGADNKYEDEKLKEFTASLYNVMLSLGVIAAISAGGVIGLKIMLGGLEAKAEAKQLLVPYVVGCVVIFGGFGIWKLIIEIFQQL